MSRSAHYILRHVSGSTWLNSGTFYAVPSNLTSQTHQGLVRKPTQQWQIRRASSSGLFTSFTAPPSGCCCDRSLSSHPRECWFVTVEWISTKPPGLRRGHQVARNSSRRSPDSKVVSGNHCKHTTHIIDHNTRSSSNSIHRVRNQPTTCLAAPKTRPR